MPSPALAVARRPHPDQVRIAALSAAMAFNLIVLLAALRPLAPRLMEVIQPAPVATVRLIPNDPPPVPIPPMVELKPLPTPAPAPVVRNRPAPVSPPAVAPSDAGNVTVPPVSTPTLAPPQALGQSMATAPIEASLAYRRAPMSFPALAVRRHMQGTVLLRVLVDEDGKPLDVQVEKSSGYPLLDRSARSQVLSGWSFQPAVVDGRHVRAWARVPVNFNLRGG